MHARSGRSTTSCSHQTEVDLKHVDTLSDEAISRGSHQTEVDLKLTQLIKGFRDLHEFPSDRSGFETEELKALLLVFF